MSDERMDVEELVDELYELVEKTRYLRVGGPCWT